MAVRVEVEGVVATVTFDRPGVRNAVDRATAEALAAAFDHLDADPGVAAIVLTGAGGNFCAGMDLKAFRKTGERPLSASRGLFGIVDRPPAKPLIAAVEGNCLGGGFEIALACDLIVAATGATFAFPEVSRGLTAAAGGLVRLPRVLPRNLAFEILVAGTVLSAERGLDFGLVSRVTAAGEATAGAAELAAKIGENAPLAVRASKQVMGVVEELTVAEGLIAQQELVDAVRASADAAEGTQAFLERRPPRWRGA